MREKAAEIRVPRIGRNGFGVRGRLDLGPIEGLQKVALELLALNEMIWYAVRSTFGEERVTLRKRGMRPRSETASAVRWVRGRLSVGDAPFQKRFLKT
jgi:hypothetical protein